MARTADPKSTPAGRSGAVSLRRLSNRDHDAPRVGQIVGQNTALLGEVVGDIAAAGIGVLISPTRDLGAISLTLYVGEDRDRAYASTPEEFATLLETARDIAHARMVSGAG